MQTLDEALDVSRKAVFFIGSPGSGKSTMVRLISMGLGFRNVDADFLFEKMMVARGLSLKMPDDERDERDDLRSEAGELTFAMRELHADLGIGIAIDTPGSNRFMLGELKTMLEQAGYDCRMIYVKASLDTAMKRNALRHRSLPPDIVRNHWMGANANAEHYRRVFGEKDFFTIENEGDADTNSPHVLSAYRWLLRWVSGKTPRLREFIEFVEAAQPIRHSSFMNWFSNSKIVDKKGNPLVCYHGTNRHFDQFERGHENQDSGIYFTPDHDYASGYASSFQNVVVSGAHMRPCYLSIKNPAFFLTKPTDIELKLGTRGAFTDAVIKHLEELGHDGAVVGVTDYEVEVGARSISDAHEICAFYPRQIRSIFE
jgi:dephospho-CoA kinase